MKKIISIMLSAILAASTLSALPLTANAAETAEQAVGNMHYGWSFGCEWELNTATGHLTVTARSNANGEMEDYVSDNQPWYSFRSYISNVEIKDGVKRVGDYSFFKMDTISSVSLGNTVESIGYSAFQGCGLTEVTIPGRVETISDSAFADCDLNAVTITDGVREIDNRAFNNNPNLRVVLIPPSVTSIGPKAFGYNNDQKIEGFTIYGYKGSKAEKYANTYGFNFVETGAYNGTTGSCTWSFDTKTGTFTVDGSGAMGNYPTVDLPWYDYRDEIKKVVIGNRVTSVGDHAFYGCNNLTEVTLGNSMKIIGNSAFQFCDLRSVVIPGVTHTISHYAFDGNKKLASVTFSEQLKTIGKDAFARTALTSVEFNDHLESIGDYAFLSCEFSEVTIPETILSIGKFALGYDYEIIDGKWQYFPVEGFTVSGYTGSEAEHYANENGFEFTSLGIFAPGGTTGDCTWSFDGSTGTMTIDGAGAMGNYPAVDLPWYDYRDEIKKVVIGNRVTDIGDHAFSGCYNLTEVTLGNSLKTIGNAAFQFGDLRSVIIPGVTHTISHNAFDGNRKLASVTFGEQLKTIGNNAFARTALTSVEFNDRLESIGNYAFKDCKIGEITIPESVTEIGEYALGYNSEKIDGEWQYNPVEGFTVSGYTGSEAERYATENGFEFTSLGIFAPGGTTGDCTWSFDGSTRTMTIDGDGAMADYDDDDPGWDGFRDKIKNVVIGNGVTSVGSYAFYNCENLTELTLGDSVETIGEGAFKFCNLQNVIIPENTQTIDSTAFYSNKNLVSVTFGKGLKAIGDWAFAYTALFSVGFNDQLETIDECAFLDCGFSDVTIPESVTEIGEKAFGYYSDTSSDDWEFFPVDTFKIYGRLGTEAERYAKANGFMFTDPVGMAYDVNGDGRLNIHDVSAIQRHLAGIDELFPDALERADVNGDGKVTIDDATLLQMYLAEFDVVLGSQA